MELIPFQSTAAGELADKFSAFYNDEDPLLERQGVRVPLFLNLKCITGGGKTLILAEAVERVRERLPLEPIVLWVSSGKVVVEQTLTNLQSGGKYSDLVSSFTVKPLLECRESDIRDDAALLLVATVATFNVKDETGRKVFDARLDSADEVLWERLKKRLNADSLKRPLVIVYDEGHNLSEQQSEKLFGLGPDALISATATPRMSAKVAVAVQRLEEKGWTRDERMVAVPASKVVDAGLVKTGLDAGGYLTPMEEAIGDLLNDMHEAEGLFEKLGVDVQPKAIYVCDTNVAEGSLGKKPDDPKQRFEDRKAPPVLIWRYLTEEKGVDPSHIAVYCNLKVDKAYPMPEEMVLFNGGDQDYQRFIEGDYRHVIFNLTLQEGWDDPSVYFAYIDKSMGSNIQVEQLIGRVLRQPGMTHYPNPKLNTAHFYVRVDARSTFQEVVANVRKSLSDSAGVLSFTTYESKEQRARQTVPPKKTMRIPSVNIDAEEAFEAVEAVIAGVTDYTNDPNGNTRGAGARAKVFHRVGKGEGGRDKFDWVETTSANRVTARALFVREIQGRYKEAYKLARSEDPRFDVMVEFGSRAATHMREKAEQTVKAYLEAARLHQSNLTPYEVPEIAIDPDKAVPFQNSLHEKYSGLNRFELTFAHALDATKLVWARNPARSGFSVPILQEGSSQNFFPDFVVWSGNDVFAIDPKGGHLLTVAMRRKLLTIEPDKKGPRLHIRILAENKLNSEFEVIGKGGYTVFLPRDGKPHAVHKDTIEETVQACLRKS